VKRSENASARGHRGGVTYWLLLLLVLGNLLALAGIGMVWPSAGWGWPSTAPAHVQHVARTAEASVAVFLLALGAFWLPRGLRTWWIILLACVALQVARIVPAQRALDHWPVRDDGRLGWQILNLYLGGLALLGALVCIRQWTGPRRARR